MFYRQNKTFWYQFCNFKHFLKAWQFGQFVTQQANGLFCHSTTIRLAKHYLMYLALHSSMSFKLEYISCYIK